MTPGADPTATGRVVRVHPDAGLLAAAAAARLVTAMIDLQQARGGVSVALTGGGLGIATLRAAADCPARDAVDWSAVDLWWGDERYLPAGHPDRNETQARAALLDRVALDPARVHPMPASDGPEGEDVDTAAARHAVELAEFTAKRAQQGLVPTLDIVLLGIGSDGHVASLFPAHPARGDRRAVVGVRSSPKPPPVRVSLTMPTLCAATQVWLLAAGAAKATAVAQSLVDGAPEPLPAAEVHGRERTLWLLDRAAAGSSDLAQQERPAAQ
ncbi:MAG TPA: 6-phosphogluconolactonase [Actinomycetes bacterium]|nr:6-phosphogluconolactonase [Actinomycetes bacterium]